MKKSIEGSGFVVFRRDTVGTKEPLVLALVQHDGVFDLPKGRIDGDESQLDAAKRECFEECSVVINDSDLLFQSTSPINYGVLSTFCAQTSETPAITVNPHSNILEHADFLWVTKEDFCNNCLDFLKPAVAHFYSEHKKSYNV